MVEMLEIIFIYMLLMAASYFMGWCIARYGPKDDV